MGSGKTTAASAVASELGLPALLEQWERNPFLLRFRAHPRRWAVPSQLFFLVEAWTRHQLARLRGGVLDDSIADVHAYNRTLIAEGTIGKTGAAILRSAFTLLCATSRQPDGVILLSTPSDVLMRRIRARGRLAEEGVTPEYLDDLAMRLREHWDRVAPKSHAIVETAEIDARTEAGRKELVRRCRALLKGSG
jgi:deoxyguanosine kinase